MLTPSHYHLIQAPDGTVSCTDCGDVLRSGSSPHLFCLPGMERRVAALLSRPSGALTPEARAVGLAGVGAGGGRRGGTGVDGGAGGGVDAGEGDIMRRLASVAGGQRRGLSNG